ncbi:structural protein [Falsiroseomonas tokyonensis]|uniref:Structural protein n=1 Tax=Falsiroseomonas tokyonensis TaxID=430521 RepID=A0ABV7C0I8_9PROT|nr:structural protein [Falsiroseomonas tokyonensis]MBU8540179.1 structural protein [Falsiroseomonas tokyonensis]
MAKNDPKTSRGYRNKNPGNIDFNPANKWQGQVGRETTGSPPRFAVFETHEHGIRALAMLLTTYQDRHGLRTVAGIINRWAPPVENQTSAYAVAVSRALGNAPTDQIDLHDYETMRKLVEAIIRHELGGNPYDAATIAAGLKLAGLSPPALASGTVKAAASVGAAGVAAVAVVGPVLEAVGEALPDLAPLAEHSPAVGTTLVVLTAIYNVWRRLRRPA